jgi:hypothetical protein
MEFFEGDTQAALDAYLWRRIEESAFREQTRQGRAYVLSHRPLIEMCRAGNIPVVAANAPRRLVRAYRKSGKDYDEFRAGLDAADQRWLPAMNTYLTGPYEERFLEMMAQHGPTAPGPAAPATQPTSAPTTQPSTAPASQPMTMAAMMRAAATPASQPTSAPASAPASQPAAKMPEPDSPATMFCSQLLWDETMAWSLANFRTRVPTHRVMLVVGSFHVENTGGTAIKFHRLRPRDRVLTVVYRATEDGRLKFDDEDRGAGDIVVYGIAPPPEPKSEGGGPPGPMPTTMPTTMPATMPATMPSTMPETASAPASMPTTMPAMPVMPPRGT